MAPRENHEGWASHIDGAIALLKTRGPASFQTVQGRETWNCVRALMVFLLAACYWTQSNFADCTTNRTLPTRRTRRRVLDVSPRIGSML